MSQALESTYVGKIIDRDWTRRVNRGLRVDGRRLFGSRLFGWRQDRFVRSGSHCERRIKTTEDISEERGEEMVSYPS